MTPRNAAALLAASLLLPVLGAAPAVAQVGLGAERYEVTITPPKRPGTEAPVDAEPQAATAGAPAAEGAAPAAEGAAAPAASASASASAEPAAPAAASPATAQAETAKAAAPAPEKPASNLPLKTLQVGAFRQKDSAGDLREALAAGFPDVAIVEVQSGGEPLYRVIVGRQPHGPALDDIKRRLAAAGHPAFEVPAPPSGSH